MSITISVLIFFSQFVLLPWKLISVFSREADSKELKFLSLLIISIAFNGVWIISQTNLFYSIVSNLFLMITAIGLIGFTYYYWTQLLNFPLSKNSILSLFFHSSVVAYFSTFGTQTINNFNIDILIALYGEVIVLFYVGKLLLFLRAKKEETDRSSKAILIASAITCMTPFMLYFFQEFIVQYVVINSSFFVLATVYIRDYIETSRIDSWKLKQYMENERVIQRKEEKLINDLKEKFSSLTAREVEIANLMMIFDTWQEIGDHIGRAASTARKHGSNIYAKFEVHELDDFRELWVRLP